MNSIILKTKTKGQKIEIFIQEQHTVKIHHRPKCLICNTYLLPGINFKINEIFVHPGCATWNKAEVLMPGYKHTYADNPDDNGWYRDADGQWILK